ncbi:MAG: helix-turn-helix domain-containing protein [Myxococcota bacterium]
MAKSNEEQIRAGLERLAGRDPGLSPKKEETRRRIIDGATALIRDRGLRRTSMEEIAERAGVSRGTLYTYAKSKEDIVIMALAEEQLEQRRSILDLDVAPRERLELLIADSIACFERMPLLARMVRGDADLLRSLERRPEVLEAFAGLDDERVWVGVIREAFGVTRGRAKRLAGTLLAVARVGPHLVDGAVERGRSPGELAEELAGLIVNGIE